MFVYCANRPKIRRGADRFTRARGSFAERGDDRFAQWECQGLDVKQHFFIVAVRVFYVLMFLV